MTEKEHVLWQSDQSGSNLLVRMGYYIKGYWFLYACIFIIPIFKNYEYLSVGAAFLVALGIFMLHLMRGIFT